MTLGFYDTFRPCIQKHPSCYEKPL